MILIYFRLALCFSLLMDLKYRHDDLKDRFVAENSYNFNDNNADVAPQCVTRVFRVTNVTAGSLICMGQCAQERRLPPRMISVG